MLLNITDNLVCYNILQWLCPLIAFDNGITEEKWHIISVICFKNTVCQLYLRTLLLYLLTGSDNIFLRIRNLTCNKATISEGCYIRDLTGSHQEQHTSLTKPDWLRHETMDKSMSCSVSKLAWKETWYHFVRLSTWWSQQRVFKRQTLFNNSYNTFYKKSKYPEMFPHLIYKLVSIVFCKTFH